MAAVIHEEVVREGTDGNLEPDELLDRFETVNKALTGEGDRLSGLTRPGGAPDSVYV
jgi:hypothetical protein